MKNELEQKTTSLARKFASSTTYTIQFLQNKFIFFLEKSGILGLYMEKEKEYNKFIGINLEHVKMQNKLSNTRSSPKTLQFRI